MQIMSEEEHNTLQECGRRLGAILNEVAWAVRPGISTHELDRLGESLIFKSGGVPSFKGYRTPDVRTPFPACLCISKNEEVVHAIPKKEKIIKKGDVVSLDVGMWYAFSDAGGERIIAKGKRLCTDTAVTVGAGEISEDAKRLIDGTRKALEKGIAAIYPGKRVGDISWAIEQELTRWDLHIVEELAGHGVGTQVHEEPFIPNRGKPGQGPLLKEGMVIAIEPIATLGNPAIKLQDDGWAYKTRDKSASAHFEHTVVVTKSGAEVLTKNS